MTPPTRGCSTSRRRVLHAALADRLEEADDPMLVSLIAVHRAASGDAARAIPLLEAAATAALATRGARPRRPRSGRRRPTWPRRRRARVPVAPADAALEAASRLLGRQPPSRTGRGADGRGGLIVERQAGDGRSDPRTRRVAQRSGARHAGRGRSGRAASSGPRLRPAMSIASSAVRWPRSRSSWLGSRRRGLDQQEIDAAQPVHHGIARAGVAGVAETAPVRGLDDHAPGRDVVTTAD